MEARKGRLSSSIRIPPKQRKTQLPGDEDRRIPLVVGHGCCSLPPITTSHGVTKLYTSPPSHSELRRLSRLGKNRADCDRKCLSFSYRQDTAHTLIIRLFDLRGWDD
ncbi:hypothetical protein BaRGS_00008494 [Batillaria attramentaria]|uniref:Uncharacterized protein n=1 Tax=Batillaria attramentaria TaxID=370345 RepID=A0ABD0LLZ9_9CAEN